jgi:hypothetical protein
MPLSALPSTTARYERAGYAKLVVVLTCKSHRDSAALASGVWRSVICKSKLKTARKTGFRRRPTRRLGFDLAYHGLVFSGLLFIWGALKIRAPGG